METKIINLVGASGTGKTYIAKKLSELDNINVIQSYTTRPPRYKDEWGHIFLEQGWEVAYINNKFAGLFNKSEMHIESKDMIAYFNSYNSGHHYFATDEQVVRGKTNIYVVDPKGAEQVHKFYEGTDVEVITIGIYEDEEVTLARMLIREIGEGYDGEGIILWGRQNGKTHYKRKLYTKIKSRIDKDKELFKVIKCDYMIRGSDNALEFIKEMIK